MNTGTEIICALILAGFIVAALLRLRRDKQGDCAMTSIAVCPKCGRRFSDWFIWDGHRYCYPCWHESGHRQVILDNGETIHSMPMR